jgi:hypothetical protein
VDSRDACGNFACSWELFLVWQVRRINPQFAQSFLR